ncbi:Late embryogenesis abundant protein [Thalictrum thalictroides]|uniref:Late embryogenesis abundant protein n=1 Tax=Thalictrum thalictroides TaxID=46969 RepID=A0A7J6WZT7_THATH|nr:Late embryogenesis abundant protein [Thalictrum thalictroides]
MADRIHPDQDFSPSPSAQREDDEVPLSLQPPPTKHSHSHSPPVPPPGTYVIQLPKEQIFRYPPPPHLLPKIHKQSPCTHRLFFIIYRPKSPKYSVDNLSIQGFNLTSSSSTVSPKVNVTLSVHNPNSKLSIYYIHGSFISLSLSFSHSAEDVNLCTGVLPVYYQPTKNVTVFKTVLTGSDVILSNNLQSKREIPLRLNLKLPVRIKFGSIKTWTIPIKVRCDTAVDKLTVDASVVSNKCNVDVKPW